MLLRKLFCSTRFNNKYKHIHTNNVDVEILNKLTQKKILERVSSGTVPAKVLKDTSIYWGVDPTGDSLHVGHLASLTCLERLRKAGVQPIILIGGATGQIGDPSGRITDRPVIPTETIESNVRKLSSFLDKFLGGSVQILNNADWYSGMSSIQFLAEVGRHFRMGNMLNKSSVQARIKSENGMSFTEFCYQILQAYDFLKLYQERNCKLQLGGSDQWGNIIAGTDLIKKITKEDAYGLTVPLLLGSDGKKLGKSEGKPVWLDSTKTSPFCFYQYLLNLPDASMEQCYRSLTLHPSEEIDDIQQKNALLGSGIAQRKLAYDVTELVHGKHCAESARASSELLFEKDKSWSAEKILDVFNKCGNVKNLNATLVVGQSIADVAVKTNIVKTKGEVKRLISSEGLFLNDKLITEKNYTIRDVDFNGNMLLFRYGKRNFTAVKIDRQETKITCIETTDLESSRVETSCSTRRVEYVQANDSQSLSISDCTVVSTETTTTEVQQLESFQAHAR